jgi:large subunit ribosomal protein L24e
VYLLERIRKVNELRTIFNDKTEIDGLNRHQIQPGHGHLFVCEDKHLMAFQSRKTFRMSARKRNPRMITWTELYRHDHKKLNFDLIEKASRIRRTKVARGSAGKAANGGAKQATGVVKQRVRAARKAPACKK